MTQSDQEDAFDGGIDRTLEILAQRLGVTDWYAADGSEDHDQDVGDTIMNILKAKGLYDEEDGSWATLRAPAQSTRNDPDLRDMLQECRNWLYYAYHNVDSVTSDDSDTVAVPKAALAWLFGEGPDSEGKWFGAVADDIEQKHKASRLKPAYWWRGHFRKLIGRALRYDKATRTIVPDPPHSQEENDQRTEQPSTTAFKSALAEIARLTALVEGANKRFAEILDCVDDLRLVNRLKEIEKIATRAMLECQGYPLSSGERA